MIFTSSLINTMIENDLTINIIELDHNHTTSKSLAQVNET